MQALTFAEPGVVRMAELPIPTIELPTDALVKMHVAGVCGSDMHPFHGREPCDPGMVCSLAP
jgi:threonine dehydrogenase-like Zn-dependent dehydrogenase